MDEKSNLSNFKHLLEEREQARKEYNRYIVEFVSDTVGAGIYDLLNLPSDNVVWEDIQIVGPAAVFQCTITYSPAYEPSEFLTLVDDQPEGESPIQVQRSLTIGIPLQLLFVEASIIAAFLLDIAHGTDPYVAYTKVNANGSEDAPPADETLELTDEQIQQMLFFQQITKGKIQ